MFTYSITVGHGKDKEGKPIQGVDGRLDVVRAHLAAEFGGFSETTLTGGYRMASGEYVQEPATRWDIVTAAQGGELRRWAAIIRDLFHQESVLFTVEALEREELV